MNVTRTKRLCRNICSGLVAAIIPVGWTTDSVAQETSQPVVARYALDLRITTEITDRVRQGDVLPVAVTKDKYLFVTSPRGKQGWILQEDVVPIADSVPIYDELIQFYPSIGRNYKLRGSAKLAAGQADEAIADYTAAIRLRTRDPQVYVWRGMIYATKGDYERAIDDYNVAIQQGAKGVAVYSNRAAAYSGKKEFEKAIKDYSLVIQHDNQRSSNYYQRGLAYKGAGEQEQAVADFTKAIELDPNNLQALNSRGFSSFQAGETAKAIADFSEVIRQSPKSALALNNRGYNYQLQGDYQQALADYTQAIELAPKYALAHQNMAWLLAAATDESVRDGAKAIEFAKQACELREYKVFSDVKALAAAFAENGEFEPAIEWQTKAIELAVDEQKEFEHEILQKYTAQEPFRLVANGGAE